MADPVDPASRRTTLKTRLQATHDRIAAAAAAAVRDPSEITLVVVTKNWPASDIRLLADLGVAHVGENRDQEAAPKHEAVADLDLVWHFIGQLQTNKARSVAHYADVVESIDRPRLVTALNRSAEDCGRVLGGLLQVRLDDEPGRGGVVPAEVAALADAVAAAEWLELQGVMAVAPLGADPLSAFERLAQVADDLRRDHPEARVISAGMSGDLEEAVSCGATHVRVGSAVLGHRPVVG